MPNWEKSEINLIQTLHKKLVRNKLREMITQRMHQCQYIRTKQLMPSTFVHHKWTVLEVFFQYKNQSCNTPIFFFSNHHVFCKVFWKAIISWIQWINLDFVKIISQPIYVEKKMSYEHNYLLSCTFKKRIVKQYSRPTFICDDTTLQFTG